MNRFWRTVLLLIGVTACSTQRSESLLVNTGEGVLDMAIAGSGEPAVVFESGFSDTYEGRNAVMSAVSSRAQTVRYNRAGFGRSSLPTRPQTAEQIARDLHAALTSARIAAPFVLVGHSAGGMYVRKFAHLFPRDVAGIVLVDPAPEAFYDFDALARVDPAAWEALQEDMRNFPAGARAQMEVSAATVDQVAAAWPLPQVPVVAISATNVQPPVFTAERRKEMTHLQRSLVQRIPGAKHLEAAGCGHNIPGECPSVVSDAVLRILDVIQGQSR
jgi:pimeloyl-ACP methyl ester carboxylesterase